MTRTDFALDYHKCSSAELKRFILDRTGQASKVKRRSAQVDILRRLDEGAVFRFLDLPPELRNIFYGLLLSLRLTKEKDDPLDRYKCWPQALATCRQVHQEAQELLYPDVELDLTRVHAVEPEGTNRRRAWRLCKASFGLSRLGIKVDIGFWDDRGVHPLLKRSVVEIGKKWPACVLKARKLNLDLMIWQLDQHVPGTRRLSLNDLAECNHLLYSLGSAFAAQPHSKLKELNVRLVMDSIRTTNSKGDDLLYDFLWPLTKLAPVKKVKLVNIPKRTAERLYRDTEAPRQSVSNLLDDRAAVKVKCEPVVALTRKLYRPSLRPAFYRSESKVIQPGIVDEAAEASMREGVEGMKSWLGSARVQDLSRQAEERAEELLALVQRMKE